LVLIAVFLLTQLNQTCQANSNIFCFVLFYSILAF
jgi:hypothetical protein